MHACDTVCFRGLNSFNRKLLMNCGRAFQKRGEAVFFKHCLESLISRSSNLTSVCDVTISKGSVFREKVDVKFWLMFASV